MTSVIPRIGCFAGKGTTHYSHYINLARQFEVIQLSRNNEGSQNAEKLYSIEKERYLLFQYLGPFRFGAFSCISIVKRLCATHKSKVLFVIFVYIVYFRILLGRL